MKRKITFVILSIFILSSCNNYEKEKPEPYNAKTTKDLIKNLDKHPEYFTDKDEEEIINIINENGKIFKEQKRR